ncbi:hypothetical protein BU25DRAFT_488229 [Macroventuria anomochaeta]|uniref:Uncharacterized protein n=1 Tax=Macroventuria anomochaeta TaxID=301207 RepID=A0ACB6SE95_9PLEO|nr:uncharacterized protein BU25DRAFT_488229 [Macroventuria anomochaeta]KAF2631658.1 hypothetical protein BU25DRAFT_488229 [Macroventuria anomochaeta]
MKPEALDAFATQSIRPVALEAAAANQAEVKQNSTESKMKEEKDSPQMEPTRPALNRLNTPFGQRTDGTESAAKAVEEIAQVCEGIVEGVKAVVHEAVVWTEKKAEELAHSEDHAGPYDSPATAAGGISDLDAIATGVLTATIPVQEDGKDNEPKDEQTSGGNDNSRL